MKMLRSVSEKIRLNNGYEMPGIGLGTWQIYGADVAPAVHAAIEAGYRHIDTASYYENEKEVGAAVRTSGLPREELFVTSKLWNDYRGYDETLRAFERTMNALGLDYLDLYLVHWPATRKQFGERARELNADTWRAFEDLYDAGRIRAIGLCNFRPHHIEELMETARVAPMVDQIEFHPGWAQIETARYAQEHEMIVEGWSPFGEASVLGNETLLEIAGNYGKSVSQLCVRWSLQHGVIPLPKSSHAERIRQNADVFDFEIAEADMRAIDALEGLGGSCFDPDEVDF